MQLNKLQKSNLEQYGTPIKDDTALNFDYD